MSSSYVRDTAKSFASPLVTTFVDTENLEEDPSGEYLSLEFNAEYVENGGVSKCMMRESGMIDLVFLFRKGRGDGKIKQAETDAKAFFANKDEKLQFTLLHPPETFVDEGRWYKVVIGVEYKYSINL